MNTPTPIVPGFHPDPSICRVGDDFYLVTSSFEFFPGLPVFHSRDLQHWRQIGHALNRASQLDLGNAWISGGLYAPTIRHHGGRFYLTVTNVSAGQGGLNFIVTAENPAGPWSEPVPVAQAGIDPSFFWDDGTCYYTTSSREGGRVRIAQSVLDATTGRILDDPRDLWTGTGGHGPEAPHMFKIGGRYYLMIAEGGTEFGHMETIARGPSPWGPWETCPRNPILTHRSTGLSVQTVGHADMVQDAAGKWWLVCLGTRPQGYHWFHVLGRETFLAPVEWATDGWPVVGDNGRLPSAIPAARFPAPHPWPAEPARDDFDAPAFRHCWQFIRNPKQERYSLAARPGWLRLMGGEQDLDNMFWPTWLGRRQQHHACTFDTLLEFEPRADGEEAGLTIFQNYQHHYDIAITRRNGQRVLFTRRRLGSLVKETSSRIVPPGPVRLSVQAEPLWYHLRAAWPGQAEVVELDNAECRYISTETGGRFTGVFFALYAHGSGRPGITPADFDWAEYLPAHVASESKGACAM